MHAFTYKDTDYWVFFSLRSCAAALVCSFSFVGVQYLQNQALILFFCYLSTGRFSGWRQKASISAVSILHVSLCHVLVAAVLLPTVNTLLLMFTVHGGEVGT